MYVTVERRGGAWFASANREDWVELATPNGRADEAMTAAKLAFNGWMVVVSGPHLKAQGEAA